MPEMEDKGDRDGTATIMWWAWGIHRAVDYLVTDPHVDGKRLAVVGHSRLGKTALLAGAFDDRIAAGNPQPGRLRRQRAQPPQRRQGRNRRDHHAKFPHWFCENFNEISADDD